MQQKRQHENEQQAVVDADYDEHIDWQALCVDASALSARLRHAQIRCREGTYERRHAAMMAEYLESWSRFIETNIEELESCSSNADAEESGPATKAAHADAQGKAGPPRPSEGTTTSGRSTD